MNKSLASEVCEALNPVCHALASLTRPNSRLTECGLDLPWSYWAEKWTAPDLDTWEVCPVCYPGYPGT